MAKIEDRERELREQFPLGGIPSLKELGKMDMSKTYGLRMPRIGSRSERGRTVYPLQMPCDFAPCGLIPKNSNFCCPTVLLPLILWTS